MGLLYLINRRFTMKKLKKLLAVILCALMAFTVVGCTPPGPEEGAGMTVINIQIYDAGVGIDWLKTLCKSYAEEWQDRSFEPGKTGVYFKIESVSVTETSGMKNSDVHFYVTHGSGYSGRSLANDNLTLSIEDVVTSKTGYGEYSEPDVRIIDGVETAVSIKDKIQQDYYKSSLAIANGECYATPNYGIKVGLSFDAFNFKYYGLYLADQVWAEQEGEDLGLATWRETEFGGRYFVTGAIELGTEPTEIPEGAKLACGNDGVYGTWDDGHPTSLEEFFILCEYMKNEWNIAPLTSYGSSHSKRVENYRSFWTAMGGFGAAQSKYTQTSKDTKGGDHPVEIVDYTQGDNGFSSTLLFGAATPNHVRPYTKTVSISRENGYQAYDAAARYYALCLMQIAYEQGWYSTMSSDKEIDHLQTEKRFVLNGLTAGREPYEKCGMLIEGDYWFNEVKIRTDALSLFGDLTVDTPKEGMAEPDILWMSLPTQFEGTVQPNNLPGTTTPADASQGDVPASCYNEHVEEQGGGAPIVINKRFQNDANLVALLKEFMWYINTDEALTIYTATNGCYRVGMDYEVDINHPASAQLSAFQRSTMAAFATCQNRMVPASNSLTQSNQIYADADGKSPYSSYESKGASTSENAKQLFMKRTISASDWAKQLAALNG